MLMWTIFTFANFMKNSSQYRKLIRWLSSHIVIYNNNKYYKRGKTQYLILKLHQVSNNVGYSTYTSESM